MPNSTEARAGAAQPRPGPRDAPPPSPDLPLRPGDEAPPGSLGSAEAPCRNCNGTGIVNGRSCPECEGTGNVNVETGGA